ncbi:hypothetical protein [Chitinophaga hostae]|uniref:Uncharacterized protein n=1 Tax=Chitinophaga hostae TaxID=2831022 RepID=A0ABS5IWD3_9BACT|nr:hypothetical protein [Chitinophaga hostae]MBS0027081.1 hypothetical protein [Chitinophaga hostae]
MENPGYEHKRHSLFIKLSAKKKHVLRAIFEDFGLDDLKDSFEHWKYASLTNEIGLYETGEERRILLEFYDDVLRMFEAFFIQSGRRKRMLKRLPAEYRKHWKKSDRCKALSKEERRDTSQVLLLFTKKYNRLYCIAEAIDMLECVITSQSTDKWERESAISLFLCLQAMLNLAYG